MGNAAAWGSFRNRSREQAFWAACGAQTSGDDVIAGLERLIVVTPLLFFGLGVSSVFGLEHRNLDNHSVNRKAVEHQEPANIAQVVPKQLAFFELLDRLRVIPQAGQFMAVLCIFTFSMFLNDAVLESY